MERLYECCMREKAAERTFYDEKEAVGYIGLYFRVCRTIYLL